MTPGRASTTGSGAATGSGATAASPRASTAQPAAALAVDATFDESARTLLAANRGPQRVITRPAFMIELQEGSPVGEYEIQSQIGEGAMGTVYSAVQPLIGKAVAIKVLKPELCANQASIDRFVQEAQAVNKIGHPNIVDVFLLGELPDGRAYFVMELLRGEDLKKRLARGPMTVADASDVLDGIARALDAAHAKGIIHRDLKPDNVFLHHVDNGPLMVKLLDFGIAKLVRVTPGTEKTQTGNMLGTPRYISPEQARGIQVDHRSDIYSLGVMAYEMLAGRAPFQGESAMDLVVAHLSETPPPLSQFAKVPKHLEKCVMRMLEKNPAHRPTLADVRALLVDPSRRLTPLPGKVRTLGGDVITSQRSVVFVIAGFIAIGLGLVTWKLVSNATSPAAVPNATPTPTATPGNRAITAPVVVTDPSATVATPIAPTPTVVRPATLSVEISGAHDVVVVVDQREVGRGSSFKLELPPGSHDIEVRPAGGAAITKHVELAAGDLSTLAIIVPPRPAVKPPHATTKPPHGTTGPTGSTGQNGKPPTTPSQGNDDDDLLRPTHK